MFKDVYREVGILEVFVTCLQRYEQFLIENSKPESNKASEVDVELSASAEEGIDREPEEVLGQLAIEAFSLLLVGNNNNANVFRECGGSKCVHGMVRYRHSREGILGILRELILSVGGDDDLMFLLSTMHSAPANKIQLKIHILKVVLGCLRDSHRTRTLFRKVGGFVYVTSVFVSLDGKLDKSTVDNSVENDNNNQDDLHLPDILQLLAITCQTLATAMRFEPANAKFFHQEICTTSLCDTLRLLGCFGTNQELSETIETLEDVDRFQTIFHNLFIGNVLEPDISEDIPSTLMFTCLIYRLLYDIALDNFEKANLSGILNIIGDKGANSRLPGKSKNDIRCSVQSLNLQQPIPEPLVVHPGIVICMLQLLPSIECDSNPQIATCLQNYLAEVVKSLVRR